MKRFLLVIFWLIVSTAIYSLDFVTLNDPRLNIHESPNKRSNSFRIFGGKRNILHKMMAYRYLMPIGNKIENEYGTWYQLWPNKKKKTIGSEKDWILLKNSNVNFIINRPDRGIFFTMLTNDFHDQMIYGTLIGSGFTLLGSQEIGFIGYCYYTLDEHSYQTRTELYRIIENKGVPTLGKKIGVLGYKTKISAFDNTVILYDEGIFDDDKFMLNNGYKKEALASSYYFSIVNTEKKKANSEDYSIFYPVFPYQSYLEFTNNTSNLVINAMANPEGKFPYTVGKYSVVAGKLRQTWSVENTNINALITGNCVNLRAAPSLDGPVIKCLKKGSKVIILGYDNKVKTIQGKTGRWVYVDTGIKVKGKNRQVLKYFDYPTGEMIPPDIDIDISEKYDEFWKDVHIKGWMFEPYVKPIE